MAGVQVYRDLITGEVKTRELAECLRCRNPVPPDLGLCELCQLEDEGRL